MNLKLLYKNEIIKDINLDISHSQPLRISMEFIKSYIGIDLDDYIFAKEFILDENKLTIVLRENDYKYIIREEKINNLIK